MRLNRHLDKLSHRLRHWEVCGLCQFALNGAHDFLIVAIDEGRNEGFLIGEVLVKRSHAYARDLGNMIRAGLVEQMPALEELSADIRTSDREYVDYVSTLDRGQLADRIDFVFTDGALGRMSREEMLLHVITHGVSHRGQISAVMLLNSVTPGKDGFTTYLHNTEALTRRRTVA